MTEVLDPQLAAFWASDPSLLTPPAPATEDEAKHEHLGRELAAAVLIGFALTRHHLNRRDGSDHKDLADRAWQRAAPTWLKIAAPLARQGLEMAGVRELSAAEVTRIATAYAESLGQYLSDSSGAALDAGMAQQLAAGTDPDTAWKRAVAGYGLDLRQMRAYLDGVLLGAKAGRSEVVPPAAQSRIDAGLLTRADRIGQNESRNATQTGRAAAWAWLEKTGRLPKGSEKEWDTHPSERGACAVCAPLDRQRAPVGGYFTTPDGRKLFSPLAHPGCRCGLRLVKAEIAKAAVSVAGLCVRAADTGRVLMLQRADTPGDPAGGLWEFPGGHLERGESPLVGARREWEEEVRRRLPAQAQVTGSWRSGLYEGFVVQVPDERCVPSHTRGRVSNPDDPDRDQVEAIAWWNPAHLGGNPAVRPELRNSLAALGHALRTSVAKAGFDPGEPRDQDGRWRTGGTRARPLAEPDPVADDLWARRHDEPVTPADDRFAADRFAAGNRFGVDSRFAVDRFKTADRFQTADDGTRFGVADPRFAGRRRTMIRRVVIIAPPKPRDPHEDTHYLAFADLAERYGWRNGDVLLDGQPVDFDDANTRTSDPDLTAERRPTPWSALADQPSVLYGWEEEQRDRQRRDAWTKVLHAGRVARRSALRNAGSIVPHLDPQDLAQIATLAGYDPNDPKLRGRILAQAADDDQPDASLADAYADYMVCVLPARLGGAGDAVEEAAEEGPSFDLAAICLQPQQVFALTTRRSDPDEITPEGEWHIHGLYYHSVLADDPSGIGPDVIGMQEIVLKPEPEQL